MFANTKGWHRITLYLVLLKIGYLAAVCGAVGLWPELDESKFYAVNARWPREGGPVLASHLATWDAAHYLYLSEVRYSKGVESCAFYPLWPLMIRWFSVLTGGSHVVSGMVLANVFSLAAWIIFYQVTARRFGDSVAWWALVFLIIFPGSLFYQFIYSEPLFFLLVMLLWFGLERSRYESAWIAAFLLPPSRAVGIFSVLPIAWYWLMRRQWGWLERWRWLDPERDRLRSNSSVKFANVGWLALLVAPPLGLALYFAVMWYWTGNPFEGMEAQKHWGVHSIRNLWDVPKFLIGLFIPSDVHAFRGSMLDRSVFLILIYTLPMIWRLGKDMMVWTYVLGILPAMSGTFTSFTRFACCAFPMFIALVVLSERQGWRWLKWGLLAAFGVLHIVLLWRFVNFRWAG